MSTLQKSWILPESGYSKFIASAIAYALSRELDRKSFEVVHEGNIDLHNPESATPDVIVYDKTNSFAPVIIVELCSKFSESGTLRTAEIIHELYSLKESFVYNFETDQWNSFNQKHLNMIGYSELFKIKLNNLLSNYLHRYI